MYLKDGIKFDITAQHTIEETQYPRGWFLDPSEREKMGIVEVDDIPRPHPALYDSVENPDGTWTSTPRDPAVIEAERKAQAHAEANAERDTKLAAGFTHDGTLWHCDPIFQSQVQGFVLAYVTGVLHPGLTVLIRAKDNKRILLTRTELMELAAALMAHVQKVYAESWTKKDAMG